MKKLIRLFILLCSLPLLIAAKAQDKFEINGVSGKLLGNIKARLNEFIENKPIESFSNNELELQIEKALFPFGFFKPLIQIENTNNNHRAFNINPGPRLMINRLSLNISGEGVNNPQINKVLYQLPIKEGAPLNSQKYEEAKQSLITIAKEQGYLHADFDKAQILIDRLNYTSSIILEFNTGPQYFFGQVRFDPTYISPELLKRYVPFQPGKPYSNDKIQDFSNYLIGSGYFKSVSVKPELFTTSNNNSPNIPVNVHLEPAARINYSIGLGYGTDTGIRGRAGMYVVPFNQQGHKFNTVALGSFNENAFQTQYIIPGLNPVTEQYEITGKLSNLNYDAGLSNSLLLSFAKRKSLPTFQRVLSLNNLYERFHYSYTPDENKFTVFPKISLSWLNKTDQLFSPNGYNLTVNSLVANKIIGSQINLVQGFIDAKAAYTVEPLRTRLYFHTSIGLSAINNINELPLSIALLLGGADNLKGYDYNSIGPGKILNYAGFEVQKETKEKLYLIGFFDIGDVYKPDLKSYKKDIGLGLMWVSPVGPIKVGLAQGVDNNFYRLDNKNPKLIIKIGPDL